MANVILLRPAQITAIKKQVSDYIKTTKYGSWQKFISHRMIRSDFTPIRIRDDISGQRFILPVSLKNNPIFQKIKEILEDPKNSVSIVSISSADFPDDSNPNNVDYSIPS